MFAWQLCRTVYLLIFLKYIRFTASSVEYRVAALRLRFGQRVARAIANPIAECLTQDVKHQHHCVRRCCGKCTVAPFRRRPLGDASTGAQNTHSACRTRAAIGSSLPWLPSNIKPRRYQRAGFARCAHFSVCIIFSSKRSNRVS